MPDGASRVGFVGLGNMGLPMARRLVEAGYDVIAFDLAPAARDRASAAGIPVGACLEEVARGAEVLVLMLPGSKAVAEVVLADGLLASTAPGGLVIDLSSSEPMRTRELAGEVGGAGRRLLDAPVSGGVRGAEAGKLTVMVGGSSADLEQARPLLEVFGRVVHAGEVGAGHAVKALNNLMSAAHLWVTSEAVLAGRRFGVAPEVLLEIVNGSSGRSGSSESKWPTFILPGTFDSGFSLALMVKDMKIAVQLAESTGAFAELGEKAVALWERAAAELPSGADHTEVARWLEQQVAGDA